MQRPAPKLLSEPNDIEGVRIMPEWELIETAPKDGTFIVLYERMPNFLPHEANVGVGKFDPRYEREWQMWGAGSFGSPTHWMPLPSPPESV